MAGGREAATRAISLLRYSAVYGTETDYSYLKTDYLWGPAVDMLLAQEDINYNYHTVNTNWALTDHQNTVRDWLNYTLDHVAFDSFGNRLNAPTTLETFIGYNGRYLDPATGLQWNQERWYIASLGTWASQDPIGFAGDPSNRYRYVGNSPTNKVDPSGQQTFSPPGRNFPIFPGWWEPPYGSEPPYWPPPLSQGLQCPIIVVPSYAIDNMIPIDTGLFGTGAGSNDGLGDIIRGLRGVGRGSGFGYTKDPYGIYYSQSVGYWPGVGNWNMGVACDTDNLFITYITINSAGPPKFLQPPGRGPPPIIIPQPLPEPPRDGSK